MTVASKTKVLILGGGCGGVAAAYALGATAERRAAFDVTLCSQGWRIGGKGASGRNAKDHQRIEEHGLHLFLGFYRTAFGLLRDAYAQLDGVNDGVFASVEDAFTPQHHVTLWAAPGDGGGRGWKDYTLTAPRWPGMPWDGDEEDLRHAPDRLAAMMQVKSREIGPERLAEPLDAARHAPAEPAERESLMAWFLDELRDMDWSLGWHVFKDLLEIGGAVLRGYFADILPHGWNAWDRINHLDFRAWLMSHGAGESAAWSETIRVIYDLAFAYRHGDGDDITDADIAAGACLKLILDLVAGYRCAPMWRMNAGMGDTVFTPLAKCIEQQGGEIRLFRRVSDIEFDRDRVVRVRMAVQAALATDRYDPYVRVNGLDCWPSEPLWDQLAPDTPHANFEDAWTHVSVGEEVLEVGRDFDHVILAIPPAASAALTTGLTAQNEDWAQMLRTVGRASVATHSVQLWLDRTTADAGWTETTDPVSGAYMPPLGTWADMTHLIEHEVWPNAEAKSCQYLVSVTELPPNLPPTSTHAPQLQGQANLAGQAFTHEWLQANAHSLWPNIAAPGVFDQNTIVSAFDHVNLSPSERYVRTPPGTVVDRLPPDWDGVQNMSLAGDWTITSINGGSAEAALESGKTAADALAQAMGVH
ncbi:Flavin containing amine oxidoreductase [Monaibacterium marinum]|uniref:Flavin containing amine oxidoreductase n=1 Tax=Pontivivens marinum TaxID=1690039 RepID=A0A2C9CUT3_9RHOB|nr:FAD-dependent oxidoreductase [Monaibacterium marinum]SOH95032.1 Flavin containing amine oxidoreductase [Monaibacterium marinum]